MPPSPTELPLQNFGTGKGALWRDREPPRMTGCGLSFAQFQDFIRDRYGAKDAERGVSKTFLWFMEEVGELASALGKTTAETRSSDLAGEFADVLGWLTTLANMEGIDLESALRDRYLRDGGRDHKA